MIRAYAENTKVTTEKTKAEIDTLLGKHGASQRGVMIERVLAGHTPRLLPEAR